MSVLLVALVLNGVSQPPEEVHVAVQRCRLQTTVS